MALQWLPLREREQPSQTWRGGRQPGRSPVSEALTPLSGMTAEERYAPGFVDKEKARWAEEDKLRKAERDAKVKEAQEMGMRIRDMYEKRQEAGRAQSEKIKGDVEAMAMEAYKFAVDEELDDASRQNILKALKAKPKAYDFLMKKGLIMADGSDFVRKAVEPTEEEWYYNAEDNLLYNRKTAEIIPMAGEMPEGVSSEMIADAFKYGSAHMGRLMDPTLLEKIIPENMTAYIENARKEAQVATENYLLGQGIDKKTAHDIAYSIPIGERGTTKAEGEPSPEEGSQTTANLIYENVKDKKEISKEEEDYYISAYGQATWDLVKKKLEEGKEKKVTPPPKVTPKTEVAPLTTSPSAFKGKVPSAFNKYSPL